MKTRVLIILMIFSSLPALAGFRDKLPIRWGKITASEFNLTLPARDSAATAVVLCDYGAVEITNRTIYTRHTRIKILKEAGLSYASLEIPYRTSNRHDVFIELKAQTLVLENGKVVTGKIKQGEIEDIKINEQWSKKKITLTGVEPGIIVEYYYKVASLDFEKLDTWYFQRDIPTLWSELRLQIPTPFIYLVSFVNNRVLSVDEEMAYARKLQWLYDTKARKRRMELVAENYILFATPENLYKVWALNNLKKKIVMKNLPGLSTGHGEQTMDYQYPQVRFDLFESSGNIPRSARPLVLTTHKDYETRGEWLLMNDRTAMIGYVQFRLKTWPQFNTLLLDHERFGFYLNVNAGGKNFSDSITRGNSGKEEIMKAVYRHVRNTYHWDGQYSLYALQHHKSFAKLRTGSSAEINLTLVNLLRNAGIRSDPLLIRTSDLGMPERMYPVKDQFNHVIAWAEVDGVEYLLDATSESSDMGGLNKLDIGTQGWLVRRENLRWVNIHSTR